MSRRESSRSRSHSTSRSPFVIRGHLRLHEQRSLVSTHGGRVVQQNHAVEKQEQQSSKSIQERANGNAWRARDWRGGGDRGWAGKGKVKEICGELFGCGAADDASTASLFSCFGSAYAMDMDSLVVVRFERARKTVLTLPALLARRQQRRGQPMFALRPRSPPAPRPVE